jgi:hypothetical protein
MAGFQFNANAVEGDVKDFSPIPNGKYEAVVVKTEMTPANDKGTEQLKVDWQITAGPLANRHVTNWITVNCPTSKEAQEIGMRFLKNVCESVGLAGFTDTDELLGRGHIIDIGQRKDNRDATKVFNEVKRCYPSGGVATGAMPAPVSAPAPAATRGVPHTAPAAATATAGVKPPWLGKK